MKVIPAQTKDVLEVFSVLMPYTKKERKELTFILPFWQISVHIRIKSTVWREDSYLWKNSS